MATVKKGTTFFNEVNNQFEDRFEKTFFSFHNLIWQLVVNESYQDNIICFHPVDSKTEGYFWEIAIVEWNVEGFKRTNVTFIKDVIEYNEACDICDQLNEQLFGITQLLGQKIVDRSMNPVNS